LSAIAELLVASKMCYIVVVVAGRHAQSVAESSTSQYTVVVIYLAMSLSRSYWQ